MFFNLFLTSSYLTPIKYIFKSFSTNSSDSNNKSKLLLLVFLPIKRRDLLGFFFSLFIFFSTNFFGKFSTVLLKKPKFLKKKYL